MFGLTNKTAIITGVSRGLGKGMAEGLCSAGAKVVILATSEQIYQVEKQLREKGYDATAMQCNLADTVSLETTFAKAVEVLGGKLDILINNAGIQRRNRCEEFTMEDWNDVIQVNLTSLFQMCQQAGREMLKNGSGKIINIASMLSFFGGFTVPAYAAAKGGVAQLTKALSNQWASKGICVNAIAPGYMATEINTKLIQDEKRNAEILGGIPMGRWGNESDMQGIAVFFASSAADYISGAVIPVDGGYLGR